MAPNLPTHPTSRQQQAGVQPHFGINRRELDKILRDLGGEVRKLRRTGEIVYRHPSLAQRPKADERRKDAPAHLVKFVRRLAELSPALALGQ